MEMKMYQTPEMEVIELKMQGAVLINMSGENPSQHGADDEIPGGSPEFAD